MNLTELSKHDNIGIDLDGTLIGHLRSHLLQQFIVDHPEKNFHIVTFRTHDMVEQIENDLHLDALITGVPINLSHFRAIHSIPEILYNQHILIMDDDPFWTWKGLKCLEIGCTVLLDDMYDMINKHCVTAGILCLHPDHF